MEAKNIQLQQKDGQLQQQGTEIQEKADEINRQQRELQTLRVRNWMLLPQYSLLLNTLV